MTQLIQNFSAKGCIEYFQCLYSTCDCIFSDAFSKKYYISRNFPQISYYLIFNG